MIIGCPFWGGVEALSGARRVCLAARFGRMPSLGLQFQSRLMQATCANCASCANSRLTPAPNCSAAPAVAAPPADAQTKKATAGASAASAAGTARGADAGGPAVARYDHAAAFVLLGPSQPPSDGRVGEACDGRQLAGLRRLDRHAAAGAGQRAVCVGTLLPDLKSSDGPGYTCAETDASRQVLVAGLEWQASLRREPQSIGRGLPGGPSARPRSRLCTVARPTTRLPARELHLQRPKAIDRCSQRLPATRVRSGQAAAERAGWAQRFARPRTCSARRAPVEPLLQPNQNAELKRQDRCEQDHAGQRMTGRCEAARQRGDRDGVHH